MALQGAELSLSLDHHSGITTLIILAWLALFVFREQYRDLANLSQSHLNLHCERISRFDLFINGSMLCGLVCR